MTSDASIHLVTDGMGAVLMACLFSSRYAPLRRVGVFLVILSGLDGLLKMRFLFSASLVELAYQVPWICLGIVACGWVADPPWLSLGRDRG